MPNVSQDETLNPAIHEEARLLLPWLANGTLAEAEAKLAARHLEECAACREELDAERRLADLVRGSAAVAPAPHPVQLARLWERIDSEAPAAAAAPTSRGMRFGTRFGRELSPPWRWIVAAQAAAILLLGVLVLAARQENSRQPTFHTLASSPIERPTHRIRVVFADALDQRGLREILLPIGAEIVAGPSPLGVYTISLPADRGSEPLGWVVAHLRALPEVRFAESISEHDGS